MALGQRSVGGVRWRRGSPHRTVGSRAGRDRAGLPHPGKPTSDRASRRRDRSRGAVAQVLSLGALRLDESVWEGLVPAPHRDTASASTCSRTSPRSDSAVPPSTRTPRARISNGRCRARTGRGGRGHCPVMPCPGNGPEHGNRPAVMARHDGRSRPGGPGAAPTDPSQPDQPCCKPTSRRRADFCLIDGPVRSEASPTGVVPRPRRRPRSWTSRPGSESLCSGNWRDQPVQKGLPRRAPRFAHQSSTLPLPSAARRQQGQPRSYIAR